MRYLLCLFFICEYTLAQCQNAEPALYQVGYENVFMTDSSRIYKPGTHKEDRLHYRPLEIDLWYPATLTNPGPPIEYGQLLGLLQERSNRFQDDTVFADITTDLVASLCAGLNITDTAGLTHLKTVSHENAIPIGQPFPLIIYLCSYNGMSFENIHLLENLASHGYIVASITSVGRYPGNMTTDPADLLEQVKDGLFVIDRLKKNEIVDPKKIGLIGYSWGGLAALLVSMNATDPTPVLSLDGSEMHYYGESSEEDRDFDRVRTAPFFNTGRMHSTYSYLESGDKQADRQVDSIFNIFPFLPAQKRYIRFPGTQHEDFSSLPMLSAQLIAGLQQTALSRFDKFAQYYFDAHLKGQTNTMSMLLAEFWTKQHGDSTYPIAKHANGSHVIRGRVFDAKDKAPLAYVNVGIPGKNKGTVTQHDGRFALAIEREMDEDSIQFSMAGYQTRTIKIHQPFSVFLDEKITELKEVVISSRAPKTRRLGNTTTSKSVSVGFPMRFLGAELGIRIRLGKRPVFLKAFNFNISASRVDTALFRLNIYGFDKGAPSGYKLQQNILVPVGKTTGPQTIDLSACHLITSGDILVTLELIEGSSSGPEPGALFLSAGFFNSATWRRPTSQATWKKAAGIGVGFNIVVQE
jgi:CarboxypepD_reg-like domain/X-Pro dipeptidyl-peptidase (S15 family)